MLSTLLKSIDTVFILAATSTARGLSVTGYSLIILTRLTGVAFSLTISNEVIKNYVLKKTIKLTKIMGGLSRLLRFLMNYIGNNCKIL